MVFEYGSAYYPRDVQGDKSNKVDRE
jgi:hypothetical protein